MLTRTLAVLLATACLSIGAANAQSKSGGTPNVQNLQPPPTTRTAPLITLEVSVLSKDGSFIPGLKKEYFRVLEDGVPQAITGFSQVQTPATAVMLVEFSNNQYFYSFQMDSISASWNFAQALRKEDWVAMLSFDSKPHILQDFTQDKNKIMAAVSSLRPGMAMSQETSLFDALYDTLDRLDSVEGRKYIILIASGRDSFSKHSLDQTLKRVQAAKGISIYAISTGQALRNYAESHGLMPQLCPVTEFNCAMSFNQADHQLAAISRMTGGRLFQPLFPASFRENLADIAQTIRNQYSLVYHPSNPARDGSYRTIKVELIDETGELLKMRDPKGNPVKYQIIAREGYKAASSAD